MLTDKEQAAVDILAKYFRNTPEFAEYNKTQQPKRVLKCSEWAQRHFFIPETQRPIRLEPHQVSLVDMAMSDEYNFRTVLYSTIKKSGKSAVAAMMAQYLAENSGHRAEILTCGNDLEQARSRTYNAVVSSIELTPGFDRSKNSLPGQWKIIEKHCVHLPTRSTVRAISNDYAGEAGANPVAVCFTEIWGLTTPAAQKLWAEMTTSPIRKRSMRIVETYAGYEDTSKILLDLYKLGLEGRRLTHDDIDWPFPDQPPVWINEKAKMFMYWDSGLEARRMPWQQGPEAEEYYESEQQTLDERDFKRMHLNEWQSSLAEFMRPEWWDACREDIPELTDRNTPCILGVDASVSNDCTAICLVSRHPDPKRRETDVAVRRTRVWYPKDSADGLINLQEVEDTIVEWCRTYNVVQVCYDQFQLHHMMQRIVVKAVAWCFVFGQQNPRAIADKQLYDIIKDRHIAHNGDPELRKHLRNAASKKSALLQEKMRLEKKERGAPIDLLVACSMASHECLRLNI